MASKYPQQWLNLIHPYQFVLKEGQDMGKNCLDYSLLLLQVTCHEIIKSPRPPVLFSPQSFSEGEKIKSKSNVQDPFFTQERNQTQN
jgi:hypothetical protein